MQRIQNFKSFNSLQTGRHIQTRMELVLDLVTTKCFNSLQTGRHIQTYNNRLQFIHHTVFQFPSNGKAHSDTPDTLCAESRWVGLFQFPSNGKAHSDLCRQTLVHQTDEFQFPSNGKAHSDARTYAEIQHQGRVSIPFKREGTFRQGTVDWETVEQNVFQFPSNGKAHSDPSSPQAKRTSARQWFQFPSNGKAHSDTPCFIIPTLTPRFQFPSNGKAHSDSVRIRSFNFWYGEKFQFPSNGKAHSDFFCQMTSEFCWLWFQFPSNGKAHSDRGEKNERL